jgi:hypothetical protein
MEDMGSTPSAHGASAAAAGSQRSTQGPWYVGRSETHGVVWIDSDYAPSSAIADLYQRVGDELIAKENAEENAAYIVQACNAYPKLVAALEKLKFWNEGIQASRGNHHPHDHLAVINDALAACSTAAESS